MAALHARLVPVNTNYRYGDDELAYLWDNADCVAVVFHGTFTERVERLRARCPRVAHLGPRRRRHRRRAPTWAVAFEALRHAARRARCATSGPATTCSCCTPAGPRGCRRASCGPRTPCSAG